MKNYCLLAALIAGTGQLCAQPAPRRDPLQMLDPAADKPGEAWCYLGKSTTVLGVPFQPDITQVTWDGALFTRHAELCFFFGPGDSAVPCRGKTFLDGWIPVLQYGFRLRGVSYALEYFSSPLDGEAAGNTVNFIRIRIRNSSRSPVEGAVVAALRYDGGDYRFDEGSGPAPEAFRPDWRYEMREDAVWRDGRYVFGFSPGARLESVPGKPYNGSFLGSDYGVTRRGACCLVRYKRRLLPGQAVDITFAMPRVPENDGAFLRKLRQATYDHYRKKIISYWKGMLMNAPDYEVPEARFRDAYRAGLVHVLLATRAVGDKRFQTDGLPYPEFFLTSVPEMTMLYLTAGLPELPKTLLVPGAIAQQQENGLYFDRSVAEGHIIPATQGHILYAIGMTVLFTRDRAFAEKVYPSLRRGVAFLKAAIDSDAYGLLTPCYAYDAELIDGHYTGQNLFALMGLRTCIRVADFLGETGDDSSWRALEARYERNIRTALSASAAPDGYVPPGLYHYLTGARARPDLTEVQTNNDWENMILAYPTEVLDPADRLVTGTLARVRREYAEGVMTYRHGMYLHQYITANMIEQYLARGDGRTALLDYYSLLMHSGSTAECFENLVRPWTDRMVDPSCPPPHAWGNSKQALLVRDFLIMEFGGRCGMDPGKRELWLFHCLSPAWVKPGKRVAVYRAPTEFGPVTASMTFDAEGAVVRLRDHFHTRPAWIRLRVPYFEELTGFSSDARVVRREGDCVLVSPDATSVRLKWRIRAKATGLSFESVRRAFQEEYRRRADSVALHGGRLLELVPEPIDAR